MERNKWEEEFKEKLNQREITPTPHAWDRLDAMLNAAGNTEKPKRNRTWLYIAASVAALVLLAVALVAKGSQQQQENGVATEEHPQTESPLNQNGTSPIDTLQQEAQTQVAEVDTATPQAENPVEAPRKPAQKSNDIDRKAASQTNSVAAIVPKANEVQPATANTIQPLVNNPVSLRTDSQIAAIDPQLKKPKAVKVDAKSLLSQVDGELEMSFREKALTTINKKYQDVKVALANRNNKKE
ncbi:hypothetical protein FLLO111716_11810 [Flavobacterium longum]|uniref:hypothetical protein n=1 Tax=Flavobacterium longum TaxID=1299340 RepID=UPI0039EAFEB5